MCNLRVAYNAQLTGCTIRRSAMVMGQVVPIVVEQDGRMERSFDIYSRLLRERVVFLGQEVEDGIAILIHQGSGGFRGSPADIQIAAREILEMTRRMAEIIARHSGQSVEQVMQDI